MGQRRVTLVTRSLNYKAIGHVSKTMPKETTPDGRMRSKAVQVSYSDDMDDLLVLRDKVGRLREEIADIQKLNEQFRRDGWRGADAQVAHAQRNERLQAIQHELVHLADLGRKVVSAEQMKEKHRTRLHLIKQERAS